MNFFFKDGLQEYELIIGHQPRIAAQTDLISVLFYNIVNCDFLGELSWFEWQRRPRNVSTGEINSTPETDVS